MTQADEIPWPDWVLRFIASDDEEALMDAVWSVGGSPPYGGVSYEEGAAVYHLLEDYTGPGMAGDAFYEEVRRFIRDDPYRQAVLDLLQVNDQITSNPDGYNGQMVERGVALAERVAHDGVLASFLGYRSGLAYRNDDLPGAMEANMKSLQLFLELADQDAVYAKRAAQAAQNAVAFRQLAGDYEAARELYEIVAPVLEGFDFDGE